MKLRYKDKITGAKY